MNSASPSKPKSILDAIPVMPKLAEAINAEHGALEKKLPQLCQNTVYKLGNGRLIHFVDKQTGPACAINIYTIHADQKVSLEHFPCGDANHVFINTLLAQIRANGHTLTDVDPAEVKTVVRNLHEDLKPLQPKIAALETLTEDDARMQQALSSILWDSKEPVKGLQADALKAFRKMHAATNAAESSANGAAHNTNAVSDSEGAFARFMREEKWMGKKGLAVAGAAVVMGAVIYGATRMFGQRGEETQQR